MYDTVYAVFEFPLPKARLPEGDACAIYVPKPDMPICDAELQNHAIWNFRYRLGKRSELTEADIASAIDAIRRLPDRRMTEEGTMILA